MRQIVKLFRLRTFLISGLLKLINNSSSLDKANHDRDGVWKFDLNQHRFLRFYFLVFSLVLVQNEKIYQILKTVFDHIFKQCRIRPKNTPLRVVSSTIFSVFGPLVKDGPLCLIYYIHEAEGDKTQKQPFISRSEGNNKLRWTVCRRFTSRLPPFYLPKFP